MVFVLFLPKSAGGNALENEILTQNPCTYDSAGWVKASNTVPCCLLPVRCPH
jgi:hypothetical protein